jgi:hypothetical protein
MKSRTVFGSSAIVLLCCTRLASAAQIGLSVTQSATTVIRGGSVNVNATVLNSDDSADSGNLVYSLLYTDSLTTTEVGNEVNPAGSLPPGNSNLYPFTFATVKGASNAPLGNNPYSVKVESYTEIAPGNVLINSMSYNGNVLVLTHSIPEIYSYVKNKFLPVEPPPAEPSVDPLAFGATGGGENFPAIMLGNDPPGVPTAGMALNWITSSGDPQITSNFSTFANLAPLPDGDENPADGDPFTVQYDTTHPGTFSKTFWLGFSDEQDLSGADAPGSYVAELLYTATVASDGSSTYEVDLVPEPSTLALLGLSALSLLAFSKRLARS